MSRQARSHLGVLLAFIVTSLVVTFPLVLHLFDGVPYGGDAFQFIWNAWWFDRATGDPSLSLYSTPFQYFPYGGSLYLHDFSVLNAFLIAKVVGFLGDFGSYNIIVLFHYVLAAWGAYILAFYMTGNRSASVVAGFIYGFSTFHAMHLSQLGTVSLGWLPLAIYYLVKYVRDGGWRDGLLAILMLLACAWSHWYHIVFAAFIFLLVLIFGSRVLRAEGSDVKKSIVRKRWFRVILPWLAALAVLTPLIVPTIGDISRIPMFDRVSIGSFYKLDPAWLMLPPPDHPVLGKISEGMTDSLPHFEAVPVQISQGEISTESVEGAKTEGVVCIGITAIILGLLSWFRRNPTTRMWCWIGLISILFAYGNELTIFGWDTGIPGPYAIWQKIPFLNMVRIPSRFMEPFLLALAMSAAGFIAGLNPRWLKGNKRIFLLWIIPAVIILETLVIPIPISGSEYRHDALTRVDEIYMQATGSSEPPQLAINFPSFPPYTVYLYHQTLHELPTIDGSLAVPPADAYYRMMYYNWDRQAVIEDGADVIFYHHEMVDDAVREFVEMPEDVIGFIRDELGYTVAYEDEDLAILIP